MRKTVTMLVLLASMLVVACGGGGEAASSPEVAPQATTDASAGKSTGVAGPEDNVVGVGLAIRSVTIRTSGGEEVEILAEVADDHDERQRGLMGRPRNSLDEDAGMLFVFGREQSLSFWMKDTLIPLSIAYIAADGRIVDIQDMQPMDTTSHPSAEPARYALEVNQGFFTERGVEVGDTVEVPKEYR